jgi:hypothetical protein
MEMTQIGLIRLSAAVIFALLLALVLWRRRGRK